MPITGFVSHSLGMTVPSVLDPITQAWVNAVVANGGTVSAGRRTLVNNLIVGLKSDGVWTLLDYLWILAAENEPSALTDMVALDLALTNGAPFFTVDQGYEASTVFQTMLSTNVNLSSYGGRFTTNSGHISAWSVVDKGPETNCNIMGVSANTQATDQTMIIPNFIDGNAYYRCNDGTPSAGVATASGQGHFVANRSGASATQGYRNGSNVITPNAAAGTIPNIQLTILGGDDTTIGPTPSTDLLCAQASVGASLSSTNVSNFYSRLRTYMTAVGVP